MDENPMDMSSFLRAKDAQDTYNADYRAVVVALIQSGWRTAAPYLMTDLLEHANLICGAMQAKREKVTA